MLDLESRMQKLADGEIGAFEGFLRFNDFNADWDELNENGSNAGKMTRFAFSLNLRIREKIFAILLISGK